MNTPKQEQLTLFQEQLLKNRLEKYVQLRCQAYIFSLYYLRIDLKPSLFLIKEDKVLEQITKKKASLYSEVVSI